MKDTALAWGLVVFLVAFLLALEYLARKFLDSRATQCPKLAELREIVIEGDRALAVSPRAIAFNDVSPYQAQLSPEAGSKTAQLSRQSLSGPHNGGQKTEILVSKADVNTAEHSQSLSGSVNVQEGTVLEPTLQPPSSLTIDFDKCLGKGGVGMVFEGLWQGTSCAVKVMPVNPFTANEIALLMDSELQPLSSFLLLGWAVEEIDVDLQLHGWHEPTTRCFAVVMEKAQKSLHNLIRGRVSIERRYLRNGKLNMPLLAKDIKAIATCLAHVHKRGYILCDHKPANVLLTKDGWRLADLGGMKKLNSEGQHPFPDGIDFDYCPAYMDEEALERRYLTTAVDVYAFGKALMEMATQLVKYELLHEGHCVHKLLLNYSQSCTRAEGRFTAQKIVDMLP